MAVHSRIRRVRCVDVHDRQKKITRQERPSFLIREEGNRREIIWRWIRKTWTHSWRKKKTAQEVEFDVIQLKFTMVYVLDAQQAQRLNLHKLMPLFL
jgi:hypothetical protein